jgi:hypothetical protein
MLMPPATPAPAAVVTTTVVSLQDWQESGSVPSVADTRAQSIPNLVPATWHVRRH